MGKKLSKKEAKKALKRISLININNLKESSNFTIGKLTRQISSISYDGMIFVGEISFDPLDFLEELVKEE